MGPPRGPTAQRGPAHLLCRVLCQMRHPTPHTAGPGETWRAVSMASVSLEGESELRRSTVPETYLERAKGQFKEPLDLDGVLWGEGKDDVVDSKERDQQESGLGQAPADTERLWCPAPPHPHSSTSPTRPDRRTPAAVPPHLCGFTFYFGEFLPPTYPSPRASPLNFLIRHPIRKKKCEHVSTQKSLYYL